MKTPSANKPLSLPLKNPMATKQAQAAIAEAQAIVRRYGIQGRDLVAEVIAERRAEAAREE